jgi:hypothetical protein
VRRIAVPRGLRQSYRRARQSLAKGTVRGASLWGKIAVTPTVSRDSPVTPERARAYHRVVKTLRDHGPSPLLPSEQDRVREAADQLIFTRNLFADEAARAALLDIERLCRELVDSDRWEHDRAMRLADDVSSCGPALSPELLVA